MDFTKLDGLIPAVVQDRSTGDVLMVAYANAEALALTARTGQAHFWSRSRQALWRKGETSGNTLAVVEIRRDCDRDAVLMVVDPADTARPYMSRARLYPSAAGQPQLALLEAQDCDVAKINAATRPKEVVLTGTFQGPAGEGGGSHLIESAQLCTP